MYSSSSSVDSVGTDPIALCTITQTRPTKHCGAFQNHAVIRTHTRASFGHENAIRYVLLNGQSYWNSIITKYSTPMTQAVVLLVRQSSAQSGWHLHVASVVLPLYPALPILYVRRRGLTGTGLHTVPCGRLHHRCNGIDCITPSTHNKL